MKKKETTILLIVGAAALAAYYFWKQNTLQGSPPGPALPAPIALPGLAVQGSSSLLNDLAKSISPAPLTNTPLTPNPTLTPYQVQPTYQENVISVASNYPSLQANPANPLQTSDPGFSTIYDI